MSSFFYISDIMLLEIFKMAQFVYFSLGLNLKKTSRKGRVVLRKYEGPDPFINAVKILSKELVKFDVFISPGEKNIYINEAKKIDNLATLNMRYLAAALIWYF